MERPIDDARRRVTRALRRAEQQVQANPEHDEAAFVNSILPEYQVMELIRHGGQAAVFRALHRPSRRVVALKILLRSKSDPQQRIRFEREVSLVARLQHVHIVPLYDCGEADGHLYYTMPIVEGNSIDGYTMIEDMSVDQMIHLFEKVCRAVHYAHQNGVIHRDLHSENVLVASDGEPRVLDFGLAGDRRWGTPEDSVPMGVLPYMSPEHLGEGDGRVDVRSDVYSLGVLLYRVVAERYPFGAAEDGVSGSSLREAITAGDVVPLRVALGQADPHRHANIRQTNADLDAIVSKALACKKEDRYQTALDFAEDLAAYQRREPILARADGWSVLRTMTRRYQWTVIGALVCIASLLSAWLATVAYLRAEQWNLQRETQRQEEVTFWAAHAAYAAEMLEIFMDTEVSPLRGGRAAAEKGRALMREFPQRPASLRLPDRYEVNFAGLEAVTYGEPEWRYSTEHERPVGVARQLRAWQNYRELLKRVADQDGWSERALRRFARSSGIVAALNNDLSLIDEALQVIGMREQRTPALEVEEMLLWLRRGTLLERRRLTSHDANECYERVSAMAEAAEKRTAFVVELQMEALIRGKRYHVRNNMVEKGHEQARLTLRLAEEAIRTFPENYNLYRRYLFAMHHVVGPIKAVDGAARLEFLPDGFEHDPTMAAPGLGMGARLQLDVLDLMLASSELGPLEVDITNKLFRSSAADAARRGGDAILLRRAEVWTETLRDRLAVTEPGTQEHYRAEAALAESLIAQVRLRTPTLFVGDDYAYPCPEDVPRTLALLAEVRELRANHAPSVVQELYTHWMLAINYRMLGDHETSLYLLDTALHLSPMAKTKRPNTEAQIGLLLTLAETYFQVGDHDRAAVYLDLTERAHETFVKREWAVPREPSVKRRIASLHEALASDAGQS